MNNKKEKCSLLIENVSSFLLYYEFVHVSIFLNHDFFFFWEKKFLLLLHLENYCHIKQKKMEMVWKYWMKIFTFTLPNNSQLIESFFLFIVLKCIHSSIEWLRKYKQISIVKKMYLEQYSKTTIQITATDSETFKVIPLAT